MALFGSSVKQSSASSVSGVGQFSPVNDISIDGAFIDLNSPLQIGVLIALGVLGLYAYKRFK